MDRIESVGESFSKKSLSKKVRKKKAALPGAFTSLLRDTTETEDPAGYEYEQNPDNAPLEELLTGITALGDALVKTPTLENVKRYRERVKQFLKYVVDHVLEVEEKTSGTNILKRKKYLLLKTVDRQLETLARDFLGGQKENIDLLGRINEVNGMLIDLLR
jgi:uncharacterized protein YaaR (DUF327 family)